MVRLRARLRYLYEDDSSAALRFRYAVLAFDLATIAFVVATSFRPRADWIEAVDAVVGLALLAEFAARMFASRTPWRDLLHLASLAEVAAIASFLVPLTGEGAGFLRVLRTLRLLHSYKMLERLREDFAFFRRNEEVFLAATHLAVFVFVTTAAVYETQHWSNPHITNYADALYFTVTTLTTTGFGDITLPGTHGKLLSIAIMVVGVTLFIRLAQALIRPHKERFRCPTCGLGQHDYDAVHCKACGELINIPNDDS